LYGYKGDFAKAKSYHERGLANSEKADPGGLLLADGLNNTASFYSETGHYKEAGLSLIGVGDPDKTPGTQLPEVATVLNNMGLLTNVKATMLRLRTN